MTATLGAAGRTRARRGGSGHEPRQRKRPDRVAAGRQTPRSGATNLQGAAAPHGFGSSLIRSSIASLGGTISKAWPSTGLEARIVLPLDLLSESTRG
jgi:hypothetical protein